MAWLKPVIGKWQFLCRFNRSMYYFRTWEFSFAIINFTNFLAVGSRIGLENHLGLGVTIQFGFPICTYRRRRILGRWITYPIKFEFKRLLRDVRIW